MYETHIHTQTVRIFPQDMQQLLTRQCGLHKFSYRQQLFKLSRSRRAHAAISPTHMCGR